MDRILDGVAAVYYPIFFITCLFSQFLLFWLIFTKTSKFLKNMRWFLYPSNVTNMVLASLTFFVQTRNVNNTFSLALLCHGPCKYLGPEYCFRAYVLILSMTTLGAVLNIHMLFYRMVTIKYSGNIKFRLLVFCLFYIFPIIVQVLAQIQPTDHESVYQDTLRSHPDYYFEPYLKFGGFVNTHDIYSTVDTLMLMAISLTLPALGFYWRRETLKILDQSLRSLSEHSIVQFRALIHGLSLQIMLPFFCYVPVGVFYLYNKYSETQILISQYTLGIMITLPAALDPVLQISFIVPYRNAVKSMILCKRVRVDNGGGIQQNKLTIVSG